MIESILIFLAGLAVGALLAWAAGAATRRLLAEARVQLGRQENEIATLRREVQEQSELRCTAETLAQRVPQLERELREARTEGEQRLAQLKELAGKIEEQRKAAEQSLREREEQKAALLNAFRALSAEALQANSDSFLKLAKSSLEKFQEMAKGDLEARSKAVEALVQPLRESLQRVDGKLGEIEMERQKAYSALTEQVRGLVQEHIPQLRSETAGLIKALRQPSARGRWGEIQLRRVVEMAGMLGHCDFVEQRSESTEEGTLRPDLIVRLPGNKQIVVDAKVPLSAYLEAADADDDATRDALLARHAQQVKGHMTALGRKAYWASFEPTPEFVVMFLPGEAFFSAALQQDPSLIEHGVSEKVIPATPTTLIALLRAVAYGWRQEALAINAAEIARLGKNLYERIARLGEHWMRVGERLGKAVDAYNQSVATLEGRVLPAARKFRDLKAVPTDEDIKAVTQVDKQARVLAAEELTAALAEPGDGLAPEPAEEEGAKQD
jgi:DNA recombination protein RmuC